MRLRLDLAYDGGDFYGWAIQPGRRTVQGEVETAISKILRVEALGFDDGLGESFHGTESTEAGDAGASGELLDGRSADESSDTSSSGEASANETRSADTVSSVASGKSSEPNIPVSHGKVRLTVAGRTDTGVHANHQVCHIDVAQTVLARVNGHMDVGAVKAFERRLHGVLPDDVVLLNVSEAPAGFDARFSALERTYVYRISDNSRPVDPRMRNFVLHVDELLDVEAMNRAASYAVGLHDFGSFATPNPGGTTIREVKVARWDRIGAQAAAAEYCAQPGGGRTLDGSPVMDRAQYSQSAVQAEQPGMLPVDRDVRVEELVGDEGAQYGENEAAQQASRHYQVPQLEEGMLHFTIVADAFARSMVRSLVNALVSVGRGKKSVAWFVDKLEHPSREGLTGPIAAKGLTLEHVDYPADAELGERAQTIRAKRTLQ